MGEREWVKGREEDEVRVRRVLNLTGQQKDTFSRIVLVG